MRLPVLLTALVLLAGCARPSSYVVVSPDGSHAESIDLDSWLQRHALPAGQDFSLSDLGHTTGSSLHLVQIRTHEPLHVHRSHDAVVRVERGGGTLLLGATRWPLVPGSVVNIPRSVPHAFTNESPQPSVALVVFSPPFDRADVVLMTHEQDAPSP